jgi:hypothetical protein
VIEISLALNKRQGCLDLNKGNNYVPYIFQIFVKQGADLALPILKRVHKHVDSE